MASISANGSRGYHKYTLNITEDSAVIDKNYTNLKFSFVLSPVQTSWNWEGWGSSISYVFTINGIQYPGTIPNYDGYSTVTLRSGSVGVGHNADGTKTVAFSFSVTDKTGQSYTSGNASASGSMVLTTIPRYLTINSVEITNKTETSAVVKWSVNVPRSSTYYSFDNGTTWIGSATDGETLAADNKSGSFHIANLTANTSYSIKVKFRRADNDLWTESGAQSFTTYKYPYCNSAPDFTIGNLVEIGFYNPLNRSLAWQFLGADGSIIAANSTTATNYKGINGDVSIANLYKSIPNAKSGTYKVKVTYGGNVSTVTGGKYSIKGTETPTINAFDYIDNTANTVAITGNNKHIVQNKSELLARFAAATPNKSAGSITKYVVTCNGKTGTWTAAGSYNMGTINSGSNVNLKLTVTDSRGLTASKTIAVTVLAHSNPTALVTLQRLNNYEDETYLTVDGAVSSVNGKNTMAIKYRYKVSGGSFGSFVTIGDKAKQTLSLDKNKVYVFNVVVTDAFGATYNKEHTLGKGVFPLFIDTGRNSIGVNTFPKREKSLEIKNGQIFLEREEANSDAIYMAKRSDTGREIGFGIGKSGIYRGVYDYYFEKWLIYATDDTIYVNGIKFDEEAFGDSGWQTVSIEGSFSHYNEIQVLKYRKVGKQVFIRGAVKPTVELGKDASHKVFTLPSGFRPAQLQDFLCQGSSANKWLCEITSAGVVSVARYGTTAYVNIPTSAWLPISVSFLVD